MECDLWHKRKIYNFDPHFIVGYCYKYTRATYDWFCGPGSHITLTNVLVY